MHSILRKYGASKGDVNTNFILTDKYVSTYAVDLHMGSGQYSCQTELNFG